VNNASAFFPTAVGEIEASHWEELIGSNLRAPLFLAQAAAPQLAFAGGAIVNIADIHAERPLKGYVVYSIAKAGLTALTRSLALELAPAVRVNAVAPGAIAWPEDGQFVPGERERIVAPPLRHRAEKSQAVRCNITAPFVTARCGETAGARSFVKR
jgi:pteridine reductase